MKYTGVYILPYRYLYLSISHSMGLVDTHYNLSFLAGVIRVLHERDYVTFGSLLSQFRLSVVCRL